MDTAPEQPLLVAAAASLAAASRKRPRSAAGGGAARAPSAPRFTPLGSLIEALPSLLALGAELPPAVGLEAPPAAGTPLPPTVAADCAAWGVGAALAAAVRGAGVAAFFPVQRALIPLLVGADESDDPLVGDICITAPTGSGKTLAYAVPLLQAALRARRGSLPRRALHALVVLPTRDLAAQVHGVIEGLAKAAGGDAVRVACAAGSAPFADEFAALSAPEGVDVLVACPGRLMEHLDGTPALARALRGLRLLVVDEADRLLSESYQGWVRRLTAATGHATWGGDGGALLRTSLTPFEAEEPPPRPLAASAPQPAWLAAALAPASAPRRAALADPLPASFRRVICSATLTSNPQKLAALGLRFPVFLSAAGPEGGVAPRGRYALPRSLRQAFVVCSASEKLVALLHLLRLLEGQGGAGEGAGEGAGGLRALVFTNSVDTAHRLTRLLQLFGGLRGAVVEFSAALPQAKRAAVLAGCAEGAVSVLVASDAAARGLDLHSLPAVVHYDAPPRAKTYVHRVGRTARAGRVGVSYALLRSSQVHHFSALLSRTEGAPPVVKETLPRLLVADAAPRLQACLDALRGLLGAERAGTLPPLRPVEPLAGTAAGTSGGATLEGEEKEEEEEEEAVPPSRSRAKEA